jgi:hypothetical protein
MERQTKGVTMTARPIRVECENHQHVRTFASWRAAIEAAKWQYEQGNCQPIARGPDANGVWGVIWDWTKDGKR